jgi:hypothetical protein
VKKGEQQTVLVHPPHIKEPWTLVTREQLACLAALDPAAPGWVLEPYVLRAINYDPEEGRLPPR